MSRKHREEPNDPTFAEMAVDAPTARRSKVAPRVDPWEAVATECPCSASVEAHRVPRGGVARVHVTALAHGVLCLPGTRQGSRYMPAPMPHVIHAQSELWGPLVTAWRITDAYALAELCR